MYFKSLYDGIHELPKRNEEYRNELENLRINNKSNYLYKLLHDVESLQTFDGLLDTIDEHEDNLKS